MLAGCRATGAMLSEASLTEAEAREAVFECCDLTDADPSDARFESVELSGCRLDGIRAPERLRGVTMPWDDLLANAAVLAAAAGIRVRADSTSPGPTSGSTARGSRRRRSAA